jgi:uncharacterized protein (TIGR03435 family)
MKLIASVATCLFAYAVLSAAGQGSSTSAPASPSYVPTLTYDVASIRQSPQEDPYIAGGNNPLHASLFTASHFRPWSLIQTAYGLDDTQISGGPDWARDNSYQVNIRASSDSSVDQRLAKMSDDQAKLEKQHMLQALLADRFQLKVHWETKQLPILALQVGKRGAKLPQSKPVRANADGNADSVTPGSMQFHVVPMGRELVCSGLTMNDLASFLTVEMNTRVVDQTGLGGLYDFTLQFNTLRSGDEDDDPAKWSPLPSAIQDQLGLRLESTKGPIQILVIDHIEKPSDN